MSLTTKVLLNKVRQKKDKTYPLTIRVTYNRKIIYIPLGYTFQEKDFDERNQRIKLSSKSVENVTRFNNEIIESKRRHISDAIMNLEQDGTIQFMSMTEIKKAILNQGDEKESSLFSFYQKLIDELKSIGKFGNARVYGDSFAAWKNFRKNKDIEFKQISFKTLKSFENFFLSRGVKPNTISVYLRTFRAVYNRAVKEGLVDKGVHPFEGYQLPSNKTSKRALRLEDISKIENLRFPDNTPLWHAKNFFLFSFYCRGINFVDLAYLKTSSILNGRLYYTRSKTGSVFTMKLHQKAQSIIDLYSFNKTSDEPLFPIVSSLTDKEKAFHEVKNKLSNYNKHLKQIGRDLGFDIPLTTYTARHSYATGLKTKGVSSEIIKESLGHKNLSVTEIYLKSFDNDVLDSADNLLFD